MENRLLNSGRLFKEAARETVLLFQQTSELMLNSCKIKVLMRHKRWQVKGRKDFFVMIKNCKR
ncbi:MAG: hypothetical protein ACTHJT_10575 [Cytophaga sp.]|uniref:hypothetical protein n=1 Tax=Cytophaga sp. TaxID=29535 RepID=UPI003F7F906C